MSLASATLPRISIVTPSLNQGRFLRACLDSLVSQQYPDLELLVVDGGSADETREVIEAFADRLTWWVSEPDAGQSDAINKGVARATGEIVAWLNADDYLLPDALATVASAYSHAREAPFLFGNGLRVDERGHTKSAFFANGTPPFSRDALRYGLNFVLQPATFIRRSAWCEAGGLDTSLRWGMDTDLWIRLSALGSPVPVDALLAASREYEATKTSSGLFERIEELRRIARRHTGAEITPGVLCYLADTLHRYAQSRDDIFGPRYARDAIEPFWSSSANLMRRFGAGPDGMPTGDPTGRKTR